MDVKLRLATVDDAAAVAEIYDYYVRETVITFEYDPPTAEEFRQRIATVLKLAPWLVAVEQTDEVERLVGYAYGGTFRARAAYRWVIETTVYVARDQHRRGIGRKLYAALLELLRLQGFCRAVGGITLPNLGSVGLHESFGFRPAGVFPKCGYKHGAWWDVSFWDLELQPHPAEPSETLAVTEVMARFKSGLGGSDFEHVARSIRV